MVRCDGAGLGRSGCMRARRVRVLRARRYASLCAGVRRYAGVCTKGARAAAALSPGGGLISEGVSDGVLSDDRAFTYQCVAAQPGSPQDAPSWSGTT